MRMASEGNGEDEGRRAAAGAWMHMQLMSFERLFLLKLRRSVDFFASSVRGRDGLAHSST